MIVTYTEQRETATSHQHFAAATDTPFRWEIYRGYGDKWHGQLYAGDDDTGRGRSIKGFVAETAMEIHKKITTYLMGLGGTMGGVKSTGINMLREGV